MASLSFGEFAFPGRLLLKAPRSSGEASFAGADSLSLGCSPISSCLPEETSESVPHLRPSPPRRRTAKKLPHQRQPHYQKL